MIEKIIIQDSSEVHSIWIPERRSLASFIIWKAFGLGSGGQWAEGQISLGTRSSWADWPAFPEFPGYFDVESFPGWVEDHLALIDASLPPAGRILASLDPDSLTVTLDPPAFRIPLSPVPDNLAACVLASRMMLAVSDRLIAPTEVAAEQVVSELDYASKIAVLVGCDDSRLISLATARAPELCFIIPEIGNIDVIMEDRADD